MLSNLEQYLISCDKWGKRATYFYLFIDDYISSFFPFPSCSKDRILFYPIVNSVFYSFHRGCYHSTDFCIVQRDISSKAVLELEEHLRKLFFRKQAL